MTNRKATTAGPVIPHHGVVTLFGYGIDVRVDKGHLILSDGIGSERRQSRLPRVNHGLKRLVVISADGMISLAALRWLADQDASFVMLDRDGSVLLTTGPVAATDTRLRRAQACAGHSDVALLIVRELISLKLAGQEKIAFKQLSDSTTADVIAGFRAQVPDMDTVQAVAQLESQGAATYWSAWRNLPVTFPKSDLPRVPEHWRTFGPRSSPLSSSPRRAANPSNAILNYLYTVLESETRLAAVALGLDPGFGVLHVDRSIRDSLACDLMEPVRPKIDAYLLDWLNRTPLKREYFFEQPDGSCRLMGSFAQKLSETALSWRREVAPIVEWFAQMVWSTVPNAAGRRAPGTRLTSRLWREATGNLSPNVASVPQPQTYCRTCGAAISVGKTNCKTCNAAVTGEHIKAASPLGLALAQTPEAKLKRKAKLALHSDAQQAWKPSDQPDWLNNDVYMTKVQPLLSRLPRRIIVEGIGVCDSYAGNLQTGRRIPHPRHWETLAKLVGVAG